MNSIGEDVINGVQKGEIAENYRGIVIGNRSSFSAGADINMIFTLAVEQEYKKLDLAIKTFQDTSMLIDIQAFQRCCPSWIHFRRRL